MWREINANRQHIIEVDGYNAAAEAGADDGGVLHHQSALYRLILKNRAAAMPCLLQQPGQPPLFRVGDQILVRLIHQRNAGGVN